MAELTIPGKTHPLLNDDYASEWMGIEVLELADGHATLRMPLRQEMLNGFGMAHGGMIFAFGDTAFALACNPAEPGPHDEGSMTVASGVDINFIKSAYRGQILTAVANRRASTGRSGIYDVQIYAADPDAVDLTAASTSTPAGAGELIAEFRGRSRTISKK